MIAYSHADRVTRKDFLNYPRIQKRICNGDDLFDMLPEEYTFKELIKKMGSIPLSVSAVHKPSPTSSPSSFVDVAVLSLLLSFPCLL